MTSIFLSYARDDDETFVRRLYTDLVAAGFTVWFDRENMKSRLLTFHHEIGNAISACDRLLLVVGPSAAKSEYVRQEWQFAWFDAEKIVTPILRKGDYADIPGELRTPSESDIGTEATASQISVIPDGLKLLHCEDFRNDAQYEAHFEKLVRQLRDPAPPMGELINKQALPPQFLTRTDRLLALRDAVRSGLDSPAPLGGTVVSQQFHGIMGTSRHVGVHGMGGIGKSVMANLLIRDRQVRYAFPDGLVWVGLGANPNLYKLVQDTYSKLGGKELVENIDDGKEKLRKLLADKAVLLVIDDVWKRSDVDVFDVLGPRCRALITTRDTGVLNSIGGTHHLVELLTDDEAQRLFAVAAKCTVEELSPEAQEIIRECGRLPLALALSGALVRQDRWNPAKVLQQFQNARIDRIKDRNRKGSQHESVWTAIRVSVEALEPKEKERFCELGVFPTDQVTHLPPISTLWGHTGGLDEWETEELLLHLSDRSLIQRPEKNAAGSLGMYLHDLIHDYVHNLETLKEINTTVPAMHENLLNAYRAKCSGEWWTGPNDGYFLQNLRHHLDAAGLNSEALALLMNFYWLLTKTYAGLIVDLSREMLDASRYADLLCSTGLGPWYYFVRANSSLLQQHPQSIFQQAYNEPANSPVSRAALHAWETEGKVGQSNAQLPDAFLERTDRILDCHPPACTMALIGHTAGVTCLACSTDGTKLVSGSWDRTIKIWDLETGTCQVSLTAPGCVISVAFTSDPCTVISSTEDSAIQIWDYTTGECRGSLERCSSGASNFCISHDTRTVITWVHGNIIRIWDRVTGHCRDISTTYGPVVSCIDISIDSKSIVTGSRDGTVRLWDTEAGEYKTLLLKSPGCIKTVSFSSDGLMIATGGEGKKTYVFEAKTGRRIASLEGHTDYVSSVRFLSDGSKIVSGSFDNTVRVWDVSSGKCQVLKGHSDRVLAVLPLPGDRTIASASLDRTIRLWNSTAGNSYKETTGHSNHVRSTGMSADRKIFLSASWDCSVKVWDSDTGKCVNTLKHKYAVFNVACSRDGRILVAASVDDSLYIWDTHEGRCRHSLTGHEGELKVIGCSLDGKTAVSGSSDGAVKIWDTVTGVCLATLTGHVGSVLCIAISADGRTIVSGSADNTLRVWDVASSGCRSVLVGHTGRVTHVTVSDDGLTVFSGAEDNTLRVWDSMHAECLTTLSSASHQARSIWYRYKYNSKAGDWVPRIDNGCMYVDLLDVSDCFDSLLPGGTARDTFGRASVSKHIPTGVSSSPFADGAFYCACGPNANGHILAFSGSNEAHWFRIRCRHGMPGS